MKIGFRRISALLMALMLIVSLSTDMTVSAVEEIPVTDAYVLNYAPDTLTAEYEYNLPYLYCTPFMVNHTITEENWEEYYSGGNYPEIFNLINTTKLESGGDGAYASIAAYCTDASTGIRENKSYRRINLEDSTYYASGAAGKIRAVILNAFPYCSVETVQENANCWLQSQGLPQIVDLQSGEAILATQTAIWALANGEHYTINAHYYGTTELGESYLADVVYTEAAAQQETEYTAQNIESLHDYLYHLDAVSPKYDAVSECTLENPVYTSTKNEDGSYTIAVSVQVNTDVREGDNLTLSAACAEDVQNQKVDAAGEYSFTFENVADRLEVQLQINGTQHGGDVYLFDAVGGRGESQSLVGYDDSALPVHGELVVSPDRILNIYKSTSEEDGSIPLANIVFDIYKVATMDEIARGEVAIHDQPTEEEIAQYKVSDNLVATLMTNVQGFATYNFTQEGQPDGIYMIVEQYNPATTGAVKPFYVAVPGTTEDGSGYAYTINVNPKNVTEKGPDIQKDVTSLDNNSDSFDVAESHTWIIRGDVPAGIGNARQYEITDVLDYRLTYENGSPVVMLYTSEGVEVPLERDIHYTLTEGTATDASGHSVDRFCISLTDEGMAYVAANLGSGSLKPEIRVYFRAVINTNASMGTTIPNDAHLDYTNSAGVDYDADSDIPEVHTGGIHLLKTDSAKEPLAGAEFMIAREATQAELEDETVLKEVISVRGKDLAVVFVDFYATAGMEGDKVYTAVTDEDGKAVVYGLAYGTYYLIETKAPAGYNLLAEPIVVQVDESSHITLDDNRTDTDGNPVDRTIRIINTKFILPDTGGMGTTVFTVGGLLILVAACLLLLSNRKRRV